jgi:hypothetical protein
MGKVRESHNRELNRARLLLLALFSFLNRRINFASLLQIVFGLFLLIQRLVCEAAVQVRPSILWGDANDLGITVDRFFVMPGSMSLVGLVA